jgi:tRNA (cmo5U34)-methyltransferase
MALSPAALDETAVEYRSQANMPPDPDSSARTRPGGASRARVPEPMVMHEAEAAVAFHRAGSDDGPLVPQYELCARGMSKLIALGGMVLDLGSGSGRFLAYLATRRPDAQVLGVELSEPMLDLGRQMLAAEHLADRVRLVQGDMTDCSHLVPEHLDLLSCMLALHQLPSAVELSGALRQVAAIRESTGCAVWLSDIVRLQDDSVMKEWMSLAPDVDPAFRRDALASEAAGWTQAELAQALDEAGLGALHHCYSPLLQVHWASARDRARRESDDDWQDVAMPKDVRRRVMALRLGLAGLP